MVKMATPCQRDFNGRTSGFLLSLPVSSEAEHSSSSRKIAVFWRQFAAAPELMFMLYGIGRLPEIVTLPKVNRFSVMKFAFVFSSITPGIWLAWRFNRR